MIQLIKQHGHDKPRQSTTSNEEQQQFLSEYNRFVIRDNVLFYSTSRNDIKLRYVLPKHLIAVAFNKLHTSAYGGHLGQQRTLHRFNERLFRPGLKELVARLVRECDTCQKVKDKPVQRAALVPIISTHPGQLVTTDITGPLTKTPRGHAYILAVIDHFTKYVAIYPLADISAATTADAIVDYFMHFGIAESILSDLGTQFQSQLLELVYEKLGVERVRTTPYHPECDGQTERFFRTLKRMLASYVNEKGDDWDLFLNKVAFAYNTSTHDMTQHTPFELTFGRKPIVPLDFFLPSRPEDASPRQPRMETTTVIDQNDEELIELRDALERPRQDLPKQAHDYAAQLDRHLTALFAIAAKNRQRKMDKAKVIYDRRARPLRYEAGDLVLLSHPQIKTGFSKGLAHRAYGPFVVLERVNDVDYVVKKADASRARRLLIHQNNMRRYFGNIDLSVTRPDVKIEGETRRRKSRKRNSAAAEHAATTIAADEEQQQSQSFSTTPAPEQPETTERATSDSTPRTTTPTNINNTEAASQPPPPTATSPTSSSLDHAMSKAQPGSNAAAIAAARKPKMPKQGRRGRRLVNKSRAKAPTTTARRRGRPPKNKANVDGKCAGEDATSNRREEAAVQQPPSDPPSRQTQENDDDFRPNAYFGKQVTASKEPRRIMPKRKAKK